MVVRVDEAGRQHEAAPVDGFFTRRRCHVADLRDPAVTDPQAARPPRRAGAVHDGRVDDNEGAAACASSARSVGNRGR